LFLYFAQIRKPLTKGENKIELLRWNL